MQDYDLTHILSSLPTKFNHFHSTWNSVKYKRNNLENLTARSMAEVPELQNHKDTHEVSTPFIAKSRSSNKGLKIDQYKQAKKEGEYHNCGRPGHLKTDCFRCYICKLKGHKSSNNKTQNCLHNIYKRGFSNKLKKKIA